MKKFFKSLVAVMLVAMMAISFTSCGVSKDPTKEKEKLEGKGYKVVLEQVDLGDLGDLIGDKTEANLVATKDGESVTIQWFKEEADAKAAYDKLKEANDKAKENLKKMEDGEAKDDAKKALDNYAFGRSGKIVWFGTKTAVKDAK